MTVFHYDLIHFISTICTHDPISHRPETRPSVEHFRQLVHFPETGHNFNLQELLWGFNHCLAFIHRSSTLGSQAAEHKD